MNRVLVLGSSGQIGTYLVEYLRGKEYEVFEFDIENNKLEDLRIQRNSYLEKLLENSDFVFFLAFDVGGSHYLEKYQDSSDFVINNLQIMSNTFESLRRFKKPFIFASSQMSNMNHSTYGKLKSIGEQATNSLNGRVVHFWNVYGFETKPEKYHVISDFISKAKATGQIEMRTSGEESREFLFAQDCCAGLEILMKEFYSIPKDLPLHLTSFESNTVLEVGEIIGNIYGAKVIPGLKIDNVQRGHVNKPDRSILKYWKPETTLKAGIESVIHKMNS